VTVLASSTLSEIVRIVWSSVLVSVIVAVLFSGGVVGLVRGSELRRESRGGAAAAYTAAALVALAICLGAVVYGLILVGQKS
jgi:hypothetical protein